MKVYIVVRDGKNLVRMWAETKSDTATLEMMFRTFKSYGMISGFDGINDLTISPEELIDEQQGHGSAERADQTGREAPSDE